MKNIISVLAWIAASIFVSELLGYFLHRLLHSGKIGFLSRSHMKHHLVLYGPLQSQRPGAEYQDATDGEVAIGNVGLEWLIPGSALLCGSVALLQLLRVTLLHQLIFVAGAVAWSFLMFSYLHDRMHLAGFWMEQHPLLKRWFLAARNAHDIHHWTLNDEGFMDKNFGIAFFFFDRLFGTLASDPPIFNERADTPPPCGDLGICLILRACKVAESGCHFPGGAIAPNKKILPFQREDSEMFRSHGPTTCRYLLLAFLTELDNTLLGVAFT